MDSEKIISNIMERVGNTDVSQQTVSALLSLNPIAEGTEPDESYFTKMADVVKSIQGNVNHVFSEKLASQVNARVEEYKSKLGKPKEGKETPVPEGGDTLQKLKEEMESRLREWDKEREAWDKERDSKARKETLSEVRQALEDRFDAAGTQPNRYFLKTALSKLDIPGKDADVKSLAEQAERIYNAELKEASVGLDGPRLGGGGGTQSKPDEALFDDIRKRMRRNNPQTNN